MATPRHTPRPAPPPRPLTAAGLSRAERLQLVTAGLRGVLAGAARAGLGWLLEHYIH